MKLKVFLTILALAFTLNGFAETKQCDLAGTWYSDSPNILTKELQGYLGRVRPSQVDPDSVVALISPHAGYAYSGPTAAYGFKLLQARKNKIETVIIVGFNHKFPHAGIAAFDFASYITPLGEIKVDKELTDKLISQNEKIAPLKEAFSKENSTEMQIPFLQVALGDFNIVIISIGAQTWENARILGDALAAALADKKNYVMIASTDMSHFLPYQQASQKDQDTINAIKEFKAEGLFQKSENSGHDLMCGPAAVAAVMRASEKLGASAVEILKTENSGDQVADKSRVVGYLSAAIIRKPLAKEEEAMGLTKEDKKTLLEIARTTLEKYLASKETPEFSPASLSLSEERGAFVTLRKNGELRGCIGNIIAHEPLFLVVKNMAIAAATEDPRFSPLTLKELKDIEIEISVLTKPVLAASPDDIILGKHGVIVKKGFNQGVFLPQVATETGWSKEEFLSNLCAQKAGLPATAWQDKNTQLLIFSADVFSEKQYQ